jgi:hypothetical protein
MVKRKRDHLPLKQVDLVQLPFGALLLASKASSTGFTPVQCLFSLSTFISHCQQTCFWRRIQRRRSRLQRQAKKITLNYTAECPLAIDTFCLRTPHWALLSAVTTRRTAADWLSPATHVKVSSWLVRRLSRCGFRVFQ